MSGVYVKVYQCSATLAKTWWKNELFSKYRIYLLGDSGAKSSPENIPTSIDEEFCISVYGTTEHGISTVVASPREDDWNLEVTYGSKGEGEQFAHALRNFILEGGGHEIVKAKTKPPKPTFGWFGGVQ